jgi:hypothetical protein
VSSASPGPTTRLAALLAAGGEPKEDARVLRRAATAHRRENALTSVSAHAVTAVEIVLLVGAGAYPFDGEDALWLEQALPST